jgi:flavin reductase (DIM6/NTAB) family NADH-FMN oxidoreductase RutF/DNA-binding IclR family transcriptional regulator
MTAQGTGRTGRQTDNYEERSMTDLDPARFRQVLGQYPTGVVVVTAVGADGAPLGMTVGSFTSVSLDPPLVAFLPDKNSSSWRALRESGTRFCVNILGAHQEDVCRQVAMRKTEKFEGVAWRLSPAGNPVLEGTVAYIDCTREAVHDAGDHHIVVGRVEQLDLVSPVDPLLFFRGGYGSFTPLSLAAGDADLLEQLRLVDLARPHMEALSATADSEVTAMCMVRDQLIIAAASGRSSVEVAPTRVGFRSRFLPPLGLMFAAYGDEQLRQTWLAGLSDSSPESARAAMCEMADLIRARGYQIILGHEHGVLRDKYIFHQQSDRHIDASEPWPDGILDIADYHPVFWDSGEPIEVRAICAPVFGKGGRLAFVLTLAGPSGTIDSEAVQAHVARLRATAHAASERIAADAP